MSKVLAVSFGRKMANTEVMLKEVLLKCHEAGHEIRFIRANDLDIRDCTGCISCVIGILSGKSNGKCIHKDDFTILEDAFYEADAVILGSPVFETSPTGTFKTFCDRMGPSHDLAFLTEARKTRIAQGKGLENLPDERVFKPRIGCLLAVGGASTENWTVMGIPVMYECMMSTGTDVIDAYTYFGAQNADHVLGVPEQMYRMDEMAQHIIDALACDSPEKRTMWRGDGEGACPVCHQNLMKVYPGTDKVECAICGITGNIVRQEGGFRYQFSDEEQQRSRMRYAGKLEHRNEIANAVFTKKITENLKDKKQKYLHVGEV
ncbi:MAG: flavodoxin family protein [Lachnospiraceae bacterium]